MLSIIPPKDLATNLLWRAFVRGRGDQSKRDRERIRERCKHDIAFYTDSFVWQFNPKKPRGERIRPFILWPFQERALFDRPETTGRKGIIWCFENDKTAVVEKSREMGASWLFLIFQDHMAHFFDYSQALNISRSAEAVDSSSPNSLFWKLRFMHKRIPDWIKGGKIETKEMYFGYPNGSVNTGEASTARAGVGGRAAVIFVDEFPQIQAATSLRERTASTSDCRFFNGTHTGPQSEFYNLTKSPEIVKLQFHWTRHPDKNKGLYSFDKEANQIRYWRYEEDTDEILEGSDYEYPAGYKFVVDGTPTGGPHPGIRSPWYDKKAAEIGDDRAVAQELDIDAAGSQSQFFSPIHVRDLIQTHCTEPSWEGDLSYDPESGRPIDLTPRDGGLVRLWLTPLSSSAVPAAPYACGCDVSAGAGATNSVASFGNARTGEKVCEIATPTMKPEKFAALVVSLCRLFKDEDGVPALLAWETPGPGQTFGDDVVGKFGYANIYFREGSSTGLRQQSSIPGWCNSGTSAQVLLEHYRGQLYAQSFINRSKLAMEETLQYRYHNNTVDHPGRTGTNDPSGARVNHGDRVIADALLSKMMRALQNPESSASIATAEPEPWSLEWRRRKRKKSLATSQW